MAEPTLMMGALEALMTLGLIALAMAITFRKSDWRE